MRRINRKFVVIFLVAHFVLIFSFFTFDLTRNPSKQITAKILIYSVRQYQIHISPKIKNHVRCKFTPTCSNYAILAIKKYGTIKGTIKTIGRLCRCTPFSKQRGVDYPYEISKVGKNQLISWRELISHKFDRIKIDVNADFIYFGKNYPGIFLFGGRSWIFYDLAQGKITWESKKYSSEVKASANGSVAAVYSFNYSRKRSEIELWDLENLEKKTNTIVSGLQNMCLSPTGNILAVKSNKQISLWDTEKAVKKKILYSGSGYYWARLSFTPCGKYLGITNHNWLEIWDVELYKKLRILECQKKVSCFSFSPKSTLVAIGANKRIELWNYETGQKISQFGNGLVQSIAFTPDANFLISGGANGNQLWHIETRGVMAQFRKLYGAHEIAISPNGELITTYHGGGIGIAFEIWDPGYYLAILLHDFSLLKEELETTNDYKERYSRAIKVFNKLKEKARKYLESKVYKINIPVNLREYSADSKSFLFYIFRHIATIKASRKIASKLIEIRNNGNNFIVETIIKIADDNNFRIVDAYFYDTSTNIRLPVLFKH